MDWKTMLAYISGSVDEELLLRNEYLVAENRILRNQIKGRLRLTDGERRTLAEIGKRLGKRALEAVANIVKPRRSWAGTGGLWRRSSTALRALNIQGGRVSTLTSKSWWCVLPRRTSPGVTTGLPGR